MIYEMNHRRNAGFEGLNVEWSSVFTASVELLNIFRVTRVNKFVNEKVLNVESEFWNNFCLFLFL